MLLDRIFMVDDIRQLLAGNLLAPFLEPMKTKLQTGRVALIIGIAREVA